MTYFDYLESRHVTKSLENQLNFSPYVQSETLAIKMLIDIQRTIYKWINLFKIVFIYFSTRIGITAWPTPAHQIIEEFNAKSALAKKAQDQSSDNVISIKAHMNPKPVS